MRRLLPVFAIATAAVTTVAALSGAGVTTGHPAAVRGTITVDAASSLTAAFSELAAKFHRIYPRATVLFNFGSSTTLAEQILGGAPADVYASADLMDMAKVVSARDVRVAPRTFARNTLEIGVKPGNPSHITGLSSLATAGVVALCGATVPCGIYAAAALKHAGVTIPAARVTREPNATSTIQQVAYGDAAAAIVYVTDVHAQGALISGVKIPASQDTIADYPIARLSTSSDAPLAQAFINYTEGRIGKQVLEGQGFLAP